MVQVWRRGPEGRITSLVDTERGARVNVGATTLADLSRSIEEDGRGGPITDLSARVEAIAGEFESVRTALLAERAAR